MDSHGGWIATPDDLIDFLTHVGFSGAPGLLKRETIAAMMTPCPVHSGYARGWFVDKPGDCWHSGALAGARSNIERTANGLCWAALANTQLEMDLSQVVRDMVNEVKAWRVSGAAGDRDGLLRQQAGHA